MDRFFGTRQVSSSSEMVWVLMQDSVSGTMTTSPTLKSFTAEPSSAEWPAPLTVVLLVAALAVVGIFAATRAPGRRPDIVPQVGIAEN